MWVIHLLFAMESQIQSKVCLWVQITRFSLTVQTIDLVLESYSYFKSAEFQETHVPHLSHPLEDPTGLNCSIEDQSKHNYVLVICAIKFLFAQIDNQSLRI